MFFILEFPFLYMIRVKPHVLLMMQFQATGQSQCEEYFRTHCATTIIQNHRFIETYIIIQSAYTQSQVFFHIQTFSAINSG
jgi:hypothetical protein